MECHLEIKHPKFFLSCSIVLHIIGCAHFVAALALFFKCITASSDRELFKAAFQHLSVWSCSIHAVYCLFALVTDGLILILTLTDESTSLYVRRSFMRACLAFPSAMFSNANISLFMKSSISSSAMPRIRKCYTARSWSSHSSSFT